MSLRLLLLAGCKSDSGVRQVLPKIISWPLRIPELYRVNSLKGSPRPLTSSTAASLGNEDIKLECTQSGFKENLLDFVVELTPGNVD